MTSSMKRVSLCALAALVGCLAAVEQTDSGTALLDAQGGSLRGPGGVVLQVPPGALHEQVRISINSSAKAPAGWVTAGPSSLLQPEGIQFDKAVLLTIPLFAPITSQPVLVATAPAGSNDFELLPASRQGDSVIVEVSHFSIFVPVISMADASLPADQADAASPADAGMELPDASTAADAGVCRQDPNAGTVPLFGISGTGGADCSTKSDNGNDLFYLTCTATDCLCQKNPAADGGSLTFPAPANACQEEVFKNLWACGCGFPSLVTPPACTPAVDAGTLPPGSKLPFGAICSGDECESGICFNYSGIPHCTQGCASWPSAACPCDYVCRDWTGGSFGSPDYLCLPAN
jgi:hypothetical protein